MLVHRDRPLRDAFAQAGEPCHMHTRAQRDTVIEMGAQDRVAGEGLGALAVNQLGRSGHG